MMKARRFQTFFYGEGSMEGMIQGGGVLALNGVKITPPPLKLPLTEI